MINPMKIKVPYGVMDLVGADPFIIETCMEYARDHNEIFPV